MTRRTVCLFVFVAARAIGASSVGAGSHTASRIEQGRRDISGPSSSSCRPTP